MTILTRMLVIYTILAANPSMAGNVVAGIAWSQSGSEILILMGSAGGNVDQALVVSFGKALQVAAKHRLALSDNSRRLAFVSNGNITVIDLVNDRKIAFSLAGQ